MRIHILRGPYIHSPWYPIPRSWGDTVITDCCVCRMPRREAEYRASFDPAPSYYDPTIRVQCRTGCGCKKNPRKKIGAGNRAMMVGLV